MKLILAKLNDLDDLQTMYKKVIIHMQSSGLNFWDEYYPCPLFANDIKNGNLYLILDENEIVSAFVLSSEHEGIDRVKWEQSDSKAFYLDRFAVSTKHMRQGIGTLTIEYAKKVAKEKGATYLRLFVVINNIPAINLYQKLAFKRASGIYAETYEEGLFLRQYGYEIKL